MSEWSDIRDRCTIAEDDAVLVLNKPTGVSVVGERHDTDLMTLAREAGEWLMPAHRIDKVTSGAVLLAKRPEVHADLARQFNRRGVEKSYLVITASSGMPERGTIDLPLSVGRKSRVRVAAPRESIAETAGRWSVPPDAVFTHVRTYPSSTEFARVWADERNALLAVRPTTGRRHQIRVHLAWIGHAIQGDPLFDRRSTERTCLHSWGITFDSEWDNGGRRHVEAIPGDDFWSPIGDRLRNLDSILADAREAIRKLEYS